MTFCPGPWRSRPTQRQNRNVQSRCPASISPTDRYTSAISVPTGGEKHEQREMRTSPQHGWVGRGTAISETVAMRVSRREKTCLPAEVPSCSTAAAVQTVHRRLNAPGVG